MKETGRIDRLEEKNMLDWNQLNKNLVKVSDKHSKLESKFGEFAMLVESQVNEPTFRIKGITASLLLDQNGSLPHLPVALYCSYSHH